MSAPPGGRVTLPTYGLSLVTDVAAAGETYSYWAVWNTGTGGADVCCTYAEAWTHALVYLLKGNGVVIETIFFAPGTGPC